MRVLGTLAVAAAGTMTAVAASAIFATPALAAAGKPAGPAKLAAAGYQCVRMQGLTLADLCVDVNPSVTSVQPGQTATFMVTVSVEDGLAMDVTVALSDGATFTSGCPGGNGSGSCSIASMNLLGSASSDAMEAQIPAAAGATDVALTATASVPTLLPWTPPSAEATVAVVAPTPTRTATPTPTPAKTSPSATKTTPASSSTSAPRHTSSATQPTPSRGTGSPGTSVGAVAAPTLPPIPLPALTEPGKSVVSPGNASGLFPTIDATASPSPPAQQTTRELRAQATGFAVPLAPAGLVVAILIALGGASLGGRHLYRERRDGKR
jgi:hypothetical protein